MDAIDPNRAAGPPVARYLATVVLMFAAACGADEGGAGASHTVNGSLWNSFSAQVTERYPEPTFDAAGEGGVTTQEATDQWMVDARGLAQYTSNGAALTLSPETRQPTLVASKTLDEQALTVLKNALSQSRVLTWEQEYTCAMVQCTGDHGVATLQVNLNGTHKVVVWPIAAEGLPEGLEIAAQRIKDATD